jgi:hypothetical protein
VSGDLLLNVHETGVSGTSFKTPPRKISHEEKESKNREFESLIIDEETEKTLNLLKEGKLTEEYTRKFLQVMGYRPEEIEYLLAMNQEEKQNEGTKDNSEAKDNEEERKEENTRDENNEKEKREG